MGTSIRPGIMTPGFRTLASVAATVAALSMLGACSSKGSTFAGFGGTSAGGGCTW